MKRIAVWIGALAMTLLACSCARDIYVSEALQLPEHAPLYTRYNLYYENPEDMRSLNMLKGDMLPFGTEVVIDNATSREIEFHTVKDGRKFRLVFEEKYWLKSPEEYLRQVFSSDDADDLTVGIRPLVIEKLRRGIVEKGMSKKEVGLAYGPPATYRTPSQSLNTWCYWTDELVGKRVIFNRGAVVDIIQL